MHVEADRLVAEVVAAGEAALPGRIVAWYVTGSYADGSAVRASDLDIVAVLDGEVRPEEDQALRRARHGLGEPYRIFVDISVVGMRTLLAAGSVALALRSRLVGGRDVRTELPELDMAAYRRQVMHTPFTLSTRIRQTTELRFPVAAPDPRQPFLGYEVCQFLPSGHHDRDTLKDMVAIGCFIATALVAQHVERPIASKQEAVAKYLELSLGPWGELLTTLVEIVRGRWNWQIPYAPQDRELLHFQCRRLLALENEFYDEYASFLASELESADRGAEKHALERIAQFRHPRFVAGSSRPILPLT